ncbi:hypothetical protein C8R34_10441 [Nitrosomonas sp. Nm84]|nr:hypothetical protein C8R34_10441 [Nitrosomonas sp. Nm84]
MTVISGIARMRSLYVTNEHLEPVFNTLAATQTVLQRSTHDSYKSF